MQSVICPFCFHVHDFRGDLTCPETQLEVPEVYVSEFDKRPPLWLMTVGFKEHGKTCYIAALTQVLEKMQVWTSGYFSPLDRFTFDRVREIRETAATGNVPTSTPAGRPRPFLFQVRNMPGIDSRCLAVYDVPGESFDLFDRVADYAPVMRAVQTVWFFVSLRDLDQKGQSRTLQELFAVYRAGMRRLRIDLRGRSLIVVYTKYDQEDRPRRVREYLSQDPVSRPSPGRDRDDAQQTEAPGPLLDLEPYWREMREISEELEDFTHYQVPGGAGFIHMARDEGMEVVFAATSALGEDVGHEGRLGQKARPARVLDPFLWATELQASLVPRRFHLVLDASGDGLDELPHADLAALWHRLGAFAEVLVYYLGQSGVAQAAGEPPAQRPPLTSRSRLVGPLFESLGVEDRVVILTGRPLQDLEDFVHTPWPQRSLVVACGGSWDGRGIWQVVEAPNLADQLDEIVERSRRLP